MLDEYNTPD
jgi:hypothetical protein